MRESEHNMHNIIATHTCRQMNNERVACLSEIMPLSASQLCTVHVHYGPAQVHS